MCPSKPLWIGSEERYFLQRLREPVNDIVPHSSNRLVSDSCLHLENHTWLAVSIQKKMSPTSLPPCTCFATPNILDGFCENWIVWSFRAPEMGLDEDFAAAAEDISNNVNKALSDDELKEV